MFSITRVRGTHGWTANGILPIHHSSAARVGTHPPAEAVEEVSGPGKPAAYVKSASEEFNLIARVCAFAMEKFVANATPAEWRKIANESTPGNATWSVSLNADAYDAGKTAKKVFGVILKRCDNSVSQVVDIIARDREVGEEPGRGQGNKLQPRPIVFDPEPPAEELESKQGPETEATPQSITLSLPKGLSWERRRSA
jgi:hypothetical protein